MRTVLFSRRESTRCDPPPWNIREIDFSMLKYESKFELNVVTESITEGFLTLDSCNFGTDNFKNFECNWFPQSIKVICNDYHFRDGSIYAFCNFFCIKREIAKLAIDQGLDQNFVHIATKFARNSGFFEHFLRCRNEGQEGAKKMLR